MINSHTLHFDFLCASAYDHRVCRNSTILWIINHNYVTKLVLAHKNITLHWVPCPLLPGPCTGFRKSSADTCIYHCHLNIFMLLINTRSSRSTRYSLTRSLTSLEKQFHKSSAVKIIKSKLTDRHLHLSLRRLGHILQKCDGTAGLELRLHLFQDHNRGNGVRTRWL